VRREQLEHVLRAASTIAGEHDVLVIGSQAVLASFPEDRLPPEATTPSLRLGRASQTLRINSVKPIAAIYRQT